MENKAIKILSFCLIALFALAVIFFAVGLLVEYKKAPAVIESTLNQFTSDVGVASEYYTPGSQQFSEVLRARIASNKTLAVVTISKDNNVIFAYPLSSPFITQGANGQPAISTSSSLVSIKNKEVLLGDDAYVVNSALYALQPNVIYSHIRISFLLILAGTLVAGIALMYLYLTDQKKEEYSQEYNDEKMAQKLKNSKLDFPEVSPALAEDDLNDDEVRLPEDFGGDQERLYDEYNLPEGAMDFPPPEEERFQIPQEEKIQKEAEFTEEIPPLEQAITQESMGFVESEIESPQVDFSEIDSNDFVIQDFDYFDENIGLPEENIHEEFTPPDVPPQNFTSTEEVFSPEIIIPQEEKIEDLDQAAVAQAQFSQENTLVAEEPVFGIDQALQGMEPPVKEVVKDNVAMLNGSEKVQPIFPQENDGEHISEPAASEPAGLFSPITGFGWESYLEERLDSELIRSASAEEDIGLMMIRIQGMDRTDPRSNAIYEKLLEFYKFRDLIFEYGQDGFSCIVHSINVDGALSLAEDVYLALSKVLEENGMNNEIGIGISTRSFRLIPGKRIFMEAEQALIHAFEDSDTAIVAFRVDPEKYRKYISEYAEEQDNK